MEDKKAIDNIKKVSNSNIMKGRSLFDCLNNYDKGRLLILVKKNERTPGMAMTRITSFVKTLDQETKDKIKIATGWDCDGS